MMKSFYEAKGMSKHRAGFGAIFNNTVNVCKYHYEKYGNSDILIKNDEINELFKTNISYGLDEYVNDLETEYDQSGYPNDSNAHVICDKEAVLSKNKIYNMFFELRDLDYFESKRTMLIDDKTLSIHLRGTDKQTEVRPPTPFEIYQSIKGMMDKNDIDNIFLATDDVRYQDFIISKFGKIVRFLDDKEISSNGQPLHLRNMDRSILNKQLMTDVYLMSKSKFFLYCFSNVSYLALTLGINDFHKIDCLN